MRPADAHTESRLSAPNQSWLTPGRFIGLMGVVCLAAYPDVLLGWGAFFHRDFAFYGFPLIQYYRESLLAGEWPLWNPFSFCGIPFLAQWSSMVFYPPSLLFLLFEPSWFLGLFCLAHLAWAGLGMYQLAWRWTGSRLAAGVAGLGFAFNGLMLNCLMWPHFIAGLSWMPWVMLTVEAASIRGRVWIIAAVLAGAFQMMTGAVEAILFTWGIAGMVLIFQMVRHGVNGLGMGGRAMLVVLWIAVLAAVQWLPFLDLLAVSHRNAGFDTGSWAMPPWGLANLLVPLFHCSPSMTGVYSQDEQQWTSSYYPGIILLLFAGLAVGRVRRGKVALLALLGVAGLWLALGRNGLFLALIQKWFVPTGWIRFPIKYAIVTLFVLPLLAAYGMAWLQENQRAPGRQKATGFILGHGLAYLLLIGLILALAYLFPYEAEAPSMTLKNGLGRALTLSLAIAGVLAMGTQARMDVSRLIGIGLLGLLAIDLLTHTPRQNPTVPLYVYAPGLTAHPRTPQLGESRAMVSPSMFFFLNQAMTTNLTHYCVANRALHSWNWNLVDRVPKVDGFFPLYIQEQWEIWQQLYQKTNPVPKGLLDYLGVSQITSDPGRFEWQPRTNALPWITAGQTPVFVDFTRTSPSLLLTNFEPRRALYLSDLSHPKVMARGKTGGRVLNVQFGAHRVTFITETEAEAREPMLVSVAQTYYPCWKVEVDGKSTPIWKANYAFQALEVPPGRHQVTLRYEDASFQRGLRISAAALLALGIFGGYLAVQRRVAA